MERLKTFALYLFWFVLFFVISRVLIFIGIHNTYKNINLKGDCPEGISITRSVATSVNGEIKGEISEDPINKYIKFNFYTNNNTFMGSYYITPGELENNNFEFYFKLNRIKYYTIELTDDIPEDNTNSENFSSTEFESSVVLAALLMLMFL